jgi:hypothetical protein
MVFCFRAVSARAAFPHRSVFKIWPSSLNWLTSNEVLYMFGYDMPGPYAVQGRIQDDRRMGLMLLRREDLRV